MLPVGLMIASIRIHLPTLMLEHRRALEMSSKLCSLCLVPSARVVQEFSTSNLIAITADKRYVTPDSPTVLPSVTNKSLMQLAADQGITVEKRPVPATELGSFSEVAACSTSAVITPVKQIVYGGQVGQSHEIDSRRHHV